MVPLLLQLQPLLDLPPQPGLLAQQLLHRAVVLRGLPRRVCVGVVGLLEEGRLLELLEGRLLEARAAGVRAFGASSCEVQLASDVSRSPATLVGNRRLCVLADARQPSVCTDRRISRAAAAGGVRRLPPEVADRLSRTAAPSRVGRLPPKRGDTGNLPSHWGSRLRLVLAQRRAQRRQRRRQRLSQRRMLLLDRGPGRLRRRGRRSEAAQSAALQGRHGVRQWRALAATFDAAATATLLRTRRRRAAERKLGVQTSRLNRRAEQWRAGAARADGAATPRRRCLPRVGARRPDCVSHPKRARQGPGEASLGEGHLGAALRAAQLLLQAADVVVAHLDADPQTLDVLFVHAGLGRDRGHGRPIHVIPPLRLILDEPDLPDQLLVLRPHCEEAARLPVPQVHVGNGSISEGSHVLLHARVEATPVVDEGGESRALGSQGCKRLLVAFAPSLGSQICLTLSHMQLSEVDPKCGQCRLVLLVLAPGIQLA
mmetsp:Transcript_107518/g.342870  ORF Transcript_107518/g.342870 Transcript_107518/m.342870 type:complete len:485 (+) Transcript_107518:1116-2570(+)